RAAAARRHRRLHPPAVPVPGRLVRHRRRRARDRAAGRGRPRAARTAGGAGGQLRQPVRTGRVHPARRAGGAGRGHRAGLAGRRRRHRPLPAPDAPHADMSGPDGKRGHDLRHVASDAPRIMVVDGSKLVRRLIGDVLRKELADVEVVGCSGLAEAGAALEAAEVDLVTTSLVLPDGDGLELARTVREAAGQRYVPVIVVSGDAQARLESRSFTDDVTDYFDKSHGHQALAAFIGGYVQPAPIPDAHVLYVEDSRTVAIATTRMLQAQQMRVTHVPSVEDALEFLHAHAGTDAPGVDLVL